MLDVLIRLHYVSYGVMKKLKIFFTIFHLEKNIFFTKIPKIKYKKKKF